MNIDPMAQAKKHPKFKQYSEEIKLRFEIGQIIYDTRIAQKMSQQELAKIALTTQKVISKIESADVNVGLDLLGRTLRALGLRLIVKK